MKSLFKASVIYCEELDNLVTKRSVNSQIVLLGNFLVSCLHNFNNLIDHV